MKLTYRQAYDRIVDAYFNEKLRPFDNCACFIGNLLDGFNSWATCRTPDSIVFTRGYLGDIQMSKKEKLIGATLVKSYGYNEFQITALENNFLKIIGTNCCLGYEYEDILFDAMSSTLDMLKKIHEENGEIVDAPEFKKRSLQTA